MSKKHRLDNAGKSEKSDYKHKCIAQAAKGQVRVLCAKFGGKGLIIDTHAGDGIGVYKAQGDLFEPDLSVPTARLATLLAADCDECEVILCEKNQVKRTHLEQQFPHATIFRSHKQMLLYVSKLKPNWILVLNDPCGPGEQAFGVLKELSKVCAHADFIITFNEAAPQRLGGMKEKADSDLKHKNHKAIIGARQARFKYHPMLEPGYWTDLLNRRQISRTYLINGSHGFKYRVIVVSNFLTDAARRYPFKEETP